VVCESQILVGIDLRSAGRGGQPGGLIITQGPQRIKAHATSLQLPLVPLLERKRVDEPRHRRFDREVAGDGDHCDHVEIRLIERSTAVLVLARENRLRFTIGLSRPAP